MTTDVPFAHRLPRCCYDIYKFAVFGEIIKDSYYNNRVLFNNTENIHEHNTRIITNYYFDNLTKIKNVRAFRRAIIDSYKSNCHVCRDRNASQFADSPKTDHVILPHSTNAPPRHPKTVSPLVGSYTRSLAVSTDFSSAAVTAFSTEVGCY